MLARPPELLPRIPARMPAVPFPCAADDLLEPRILWLPAELGANLFRRGDQHRRVAGAARADFVGNRMPGDGARRLDHLKVREAAAVAEVIPAHAQSIERLHRQDMRLG